MGEQCCKVQGNPSFTAQSKCTEGVSLPYYIYLLLKFISYTVGVISLLTCSNNCVGLFREMLCNFVNGAHFFHQL